MAGAAIKESIIYVFGGYPDGSNPLSQSQSYNFISNTWKRLGDMPILSYRTSASCVDGFIYFSYSWNIFTPHQITTKIHVSFRIFIYLTT